MMLNFLALETLRAFVEGGTVAEASARVHRTEPQVSRLLTGLQDAMGFPILRKEGRSLVLTPEGRELYEKVEFLLHAADEVQDFSRETRRRRLNHVKIVSAPHMAEGLLADVFTRVKANNPQFTASVDTRGLRDIESLLGQNQFDIAFTQLPVEHPRVEVREVVQSHAVVVMHHDHPLSRHRVVTAEQLRKHCMILLPPQSVIRQRYETAFGKVAPESQFVVTSGPLAAQLAAKGAGVALVDPFAALSQLPVGAAIRTFDLDIPLSYGALLPKGRPASHATEAVMSEIANVVRERLSQLRELL